MKTVAGQRKTKFRGVERVGWSFAFAAEAYNLIRLPKLIEARALYGGKRGLAAPASAATGRKGLTPFRKFERKLIRLGRQSPFSAAC